MGASLAVSGTDSFGLYWTLKARHKVGLLNLLCEC